MRLLLRNPFARSAREFRPGRHGVDGRAAFRRRVVHHRRDHRGARAVVSPIYSAIAADRSARSWRHTANAAGLPSRAIVPH